MKYNLKNNQKGQALLFVIVALTISLAIGVGISVRTISSLSRTSKTDTASRVLAAAEGGIERYLTLSAKELDDAIDGKECPYGTEADPSSNGCIISFESGLDNITSQALVTVTNYEPLFYPFNLESGAVKEINLDGYSPQEIDLCLMTGAELMYFSYGSKGVLSQGGFRTEVGMPGKYKSNEFTMGTPTNYDGNTYYCGSINVGKDAYGLRIRALGGNAVVRINPAGNDYLPLQGYEIVSQGELQQESEVTASRTIRVIRTLPYIPAAFDFALYSVNTIIK